MGGKGSGVESRGGERWLRGEMGRGRGVEASLGEWRGGVGGQ